MADKRAESILCAPDEEGSLDYVTSAVTLFKYSGCDKRFLRKAISPKVNSKRIDFSKIAAFKLLVHEYTHYLDLTTTNWGVEYLYRRNRALESVSEKGAEAISVAMLNTAEIKVHEELVKVHKHVKFVDATTRFKLIYNDRHGVIVLLYVYVGGELVAEVPLSMLSLLEANAVAHEIMAEVKWVSTVAGGLDDYQAQRINSRLDEVIKDPARLEYNILHLLIRIHFPELDFVSRLKMGVSIFEFALDASSLTMAAMANTIVAMFETSDKADAICNDLCRGMSRQVIAFKTILMVYGYAQDTNMNTMALASLLKRAPMELINSAVTHYGTELPGTEKFSFNDFEYRASMSRLRVEKSRFEFDGHAVAMQRNRRVRKLAPFVADNLRRLRLPDLMLDDLQTFRMPGRLRFNIYKFCDENHGSYWALRKLVKDQSIMKKFHMKPGEWGPMQELRHHALMSYIRGEYDTH